MSAHSTKSFSCESVQVSAISEGEMEPDSEPLSAIPFVEDTTDVVDKDPDWDRESDWSEDSSIAWSEDEDDRLCNEILRQPTESWPLVNEGIFDELDSLDWNLVQNYFNQN